MRRVALPLVLMGMLVTSAVSCSRGDDAEVARLHSELASTRADAAAVKAAATAAESKPRLWRDAAMETLLRQLGDGDHAEDEAVVLRWQHGVLDGWVELDEENGRKRNLLDGNLQHFSKLARDANKADFKGFSGDIIIVLRRAPGAPVDEFQCHVVEQFRWTTGPGNETSFIRSPKGKVRLERRMVGEGSFTRFEGGSSDRSITLQRYVGQKAVPWLKLELVDAPK